MAGSTRKLVVAAILALSSSISCLAAPPVKAWAPFGPDGGDARRIVQDPRDHRHLYLGTANGWIYESHTGGTNWTRLAQLGQRDDLVLDNIVVDAKNPNHLVVAAWVIDHPDGGIFFSWDAGVTWTIQAEMRGQSIRALASSPSDPNTLVAGTLQGVFRSTDGGQRWQRISPESNAEIHNVESIAIDPVDPNIIYAGTWHLPWKTTDGGAHWDSIKEGIIEDSDVFSIIIDPVTPATVFASACSGIYLSRNAGHRFEKVQGIPKEARRTRKLLQDPANRDTVFAGTTEGLYRTIDGGKLWIPLTSPSTIVNDVFVDPEDDQRILIATDRGGVLASDDGGNTFHPSNRGFSARQITALKVDKNHPETMFVGVVNDKDWGGIFQSDNGGKNWIQRSDGLDGRDVFSIGQAPDGTILAGTNHGLFRLDSLTRAWNRVESAPGTPPEKQTVETILAHPQGKNARSAAARKPILVPSTSRVFDGSVYAFATSGDKLLANTSVGLLTSVDNGLSWAATAPPESADWRFLAAAGKRVVAASLHSIVLSNDGGVIWEPIDLPKPLIQIAALSIDSDGEIWVGGAQGVFVSANAGRTWTTPTNLFLSAVNSIYFDESTNRITITTGGNNGVIFTVRLPDKQVTFVETGWNLRLARPMGDHLVAATLFDGIVVQPRMVVTPIEPSQAALSPAHVDATKSSPN